MNLKDAVRIFTFDQIKDRFIELYPDQADYISEYRKVFNQLKKKRINKKESHNFQIFIDYIIPEEEEELDEKPHHDVYGKQKEDPETHWGLEFCSFSEWLGFEIAPETLAKYTLVDIICHCLNEMTFISFEEPEIRQHKREIRRRTDRIKQMLNRKI